VKGQSFEEIGKRWGIREQLGDPDSPGSEFAWVDESNYYYIKVENQPENEGETLKRTLVLDNLIHGYFILDHPERLDYDYEHIYALVAYRAAKAGGKVTFKATNGNGKDNAPPRADADMSTKKGSTTPPDAGHESKGAAKAPSKPDSAGSKPSAGLKSVQASDDADKDKKVKNERRVQSETKDRLDFFDEEQTASSIPSVEKSTMKTLFLGGGAYCFQRHMQYAYPGTGVDVAEIDPAVTNANYRATGLPKDTPIKTYWGDARQFVELHQDTNQYDLVFGDAFNDFSVPWHLTTREFNDKIKKMLTPNGVYMINIIDVYESDAHAEKEAKIKIDEDNVTDPAEQTKIRAEALARAHRYGGFVGAWTKTAKLTFPNVYIFGTDHTPGNGLRETFVVVASMQPLDLNDLGTRADDPKFYTKKSRTEPKPYGRDDEAAVDLRSRQIVLTDDYAPVENLLAPVAETRADD
jgi:hypothetical protein